MKYNFEIRIERDFTQASLLELLQMHKDHCDDETPLESRHRLEIDGLRASNLTVWVAWAKSEAAGIIAIKEINPKHGELKSTHVRISHRGSGLAERLMEVVISHARAQGFERLSLETGATQNFQAATRFYEKHGFMDCEAFEGYRPDPNSVFMSLTL